MSGIAFFSFVVLLVGWFVGLDLEPTTAAAGDDLLATFFMTFPTEVLEAAGADGLDELARLGDLLVDVGLRAAAFLVEAAFLSTATFRLTLAFTGALFERAEDFVELFLELSFALSLAMPGWSPRIVQSQSFIACKNWPTPN